MNQHNKYTVKDLIWHIAWIGIGIAGFILADVCTISTCVSFVLGYILGGTLVTIYATVIYNKEHTSGHKQ